MVKTMNTRIQNKHDTELNWTRSTLIPLQGELIIYDCEVDADGNTLELPSNRTVPYTHERFKLGDGFTSVNDLPFVDVLVDSELDTGSENPVQNKTIATEIADINIRSFLAFRE